MINNQNTFKSDQDILDNSSEDGDDDLPIYGHHHTRKSILRQSFIDKNRRIQSMHNLTIDKSRSNSEDALNNVTASRDQLSEIVNSNSVIDAKKQKERKSKKNFFVRYKDTRILIFFINFPIQ